MGKHDLPEPEGINLDPSKNRWPAPKTVFSSYKHKNDREVAAHLIITYMPMTLTVEDLMAWWKTRPALSKIVIANIDLVYDTENHNKPVGAWPITLKTEDNDLNARVRAEVNGSWHDDNAGPFKHFECTAIDWNEPVVVTPWDETGLVYVDIKRRVDKAREAEKRSQAEKEAKAASN